MSRIISVFGSSGPQPKSDAYEVARKTGQLLAEAGFTVQTGGYAGVMAGVSQGANEAGGHVIGITSAKIESFRAFPPNQWIIEEIKYQTLQERLLHLVNQCDGCIVLPGGIGTLSELSLIWSLVQVEEIEPLPIITVGEMWQRTLAAFITTEYVRSSYQALINIVNTPEEAVKIITADIAT
ncbi:LOG family protein [Anaerolineales bacterium HSG25]|nr:LOG family protein [Anaerolineales bacterium HSG25]